MDQVRDPAVALAAVSEALDLGYRSVDTASSYGNEQPVGEAIRRSGIPRSEVFVTSKVRQEDQGFDDTLRAFDRSLASFGFDYLDSYLIHWPGRYQYVDTWRALERLYLEGRTRAIGVANFLPRHLEHLLEVAAVAPMVDQVEWHPYFQQREVAAFCRARDILVEAWSPLMCGGVALADRTIGEIAERLGRSPAQVILRWHVQQGRRIFPKSVTPARLAENLAIFDFALTPADLDRIDALGGRAWRIGPDPDVFFTI
jgi:diketogulonate reductase-like aldo/keto reductase